jgi:hypothetical protein
VGGRVEPPRAVSESDGLDDALGELTLQVRGIRHIEERRLDLGRLPHQLRQDRANGVEHLFDLGRLHEGLEVVEERRVRGVVPLEAFGVALLELEVPLEGGEERGEVVVRASVHPDLVALRPGTQQLGAELRRHAPRLLPVPPGHANQARVVRVVLERLLERPELLE